MHDTIVILAGGASSRMKNSEPNLDLSKNEINQSNKLSKGLIAIDKSGRPLLDYLLFNAKQAGYKNVIIVIGPKSGKFKKLYGEKLNNNFFHGLTISYAIQHIPENREKPLGTADAVFQAMEQFPHLKTECFTVCNSDNLYSVRAFNALRQTKHNNALIVYDSDELGLPVESVSRFAVLEIKNNVLINIVEKPLKNKLDFYRNDAGIIGVSMNIFKFSGNDLCTYFKECPIHPERNEKEIPTVLMNFIKHGNGSVVAISMSELVPDLTSKDDIPKLKDFISINFGELNWKMEPD